jgi:hypothetical protein
MQNAPIEEIERWMSAYYRDPRPDALEQAVRTLSREGMLSDSNAVQPIMFFLSFLFRAHPDRIDEWASPLIADLPGVDRESIITAVWLSDTDRARDYLNNLTTTGGPEVRQCARQIAATLPPELDRVPVDSPAILDNLWAAFMATGDAIYVVRVISALAEDTVDLDDSVQLLRNTAEWSLASNARRDSRVLSICRAQVGEQPPAVAAILQSIVEGAAG